MLPPLPVRSNGRYAFNIVGESHYQDAIEAIVGGRTREGADEVADAVLACERDNPHDGNAVRVDIEGRTVGYLSREHAEKYRRWTATLSPPDRDVTCPARIVGGWDRGNGNRGHFGVKLDLPFRKLTTGFGKPPASRSIPATRRQVARADGIVAQGRQAIVMGVRLLIGGLAIIAIWAACRK